MTASSASRPYDYLKRALDIVAAALGLIVSSPVQLAVAIAVAVKFGRPVLFRQDRPGKDGAVFKLYKFRTMKHVDESMGFITDEQRLSSFGVRLRSTSLDELPSLWNVLRGEMSIIGPRPLLVEYLTRYTPTQALRHEVRPGITGLAQVNGRNTAEWRQRLALDVQYVEQRSLALDARILVGTVRTVFAREGISAEGHATMRKFGEADG